MTCALSSSVSQAFFFQRGNDLEHLRHVVGGPWFMVRAGYAQGIRVLMQGGNHAVGQAADGLAVLQRTLDDFVVNVGDVAHIGHPQPVAFEPALHHIKRHHGARMTQVAQVIDRHAADVHADVAGLNRRKMFQRTRQRVVNAQTHGYFKGREIGAA